MLLDKVAVVTDSNPVVLDNMNTIEMLVPNSLSLIPGKNAEFR